MDKLPPIPGAKKEHIRCAYVQASIWYQDFVLHPECPNPLQLRWRQQGDRLMPVMSEDPPAPDSVLQRVECKCGDTNFESTNTRTRRCSCKRNNPACYSSSSANVVTLISNQRTHVPEDARANETTLHATAHRVQMW